MALFRGINQESIVGDLVFVLSQETDVLHQFAEIALQFGKGDRSGAASFPGVAEELGVESEAVEGGVAALSYIFVQSARLSLSTDDFERALREEAGFTEEDALEIMRSLFNDNREALRNVLVAADASLPIPRYHNLEWRLEVQVASRSAHHTAEPSFTLQMDTILPAKRGGNATNRVGSNSGTANATGGCTEAWTASVSDLSHVTQKLDQALKESRSVASMRIRSNVN